MQTITPEFLAAHTALCALEHNYCAQLSSPPELNPFRLALATAVAVAAGCAIQPPHGTTWTGPVLVLSQTQTSKALRDDAKKMQALFGPVAEGALTLIGSDELGARGFTCPEGVPTFVPHQGAFVGLLMSTGAKLAVVDFPAAPWTGASFAIEGHRRRVGVLATAWNRVDCSSLAAFQQLLELTTIDGSPALRFGRPYSGHFRPLSLDGLIAGDAV